MAGPTRSIKIVVVPSSNRNLGRRGGSPQRICRNFIYLAQSRFSCVLFRGTLTGMRFSLWHIMLLGLWVAIDALMILSLRVGF